MKFHSDSPSEVFVFSAKVMSIPLFVDRSIEVGWHFDEKFPLEERKITVRMKRILKM